MTISVAKAMGRPTSTAAVSARLAAGIAHRGATRRWMMFSTMMIEASTSRPTAMATPPRVMVLMPDARVVQEDAGQGDETAGS